MPPRRHALLRLLVSVWAVALGTVILTSCQHRPTFAEAAAAYDSFPAPPETVPKAP